MKAYHVIWSIGAIVSLQNLYNFIKAENPKNAKKLITDLVAMGNSLSTLPFRFPLEPSLREEPEAFRFAIKKNYKLIYTIEDNQVMIVEVFDTRRDPRQILK
jgi:toxin ParE1/3/4